MNNARPVNDLSRQEALMAATVILVIAVIWVRYAGIIHDSILYTFQALSETDPAKYGSDIFLAYGSQNQFTLFSPIFAVVIKGFGIPWANAILYLIGLVLWLAGAGFLARVLGMPAILTVALLAMFPLPYGPENVVPSGESAAIFHAKEPFLTPRLYAEGLSLFGLGLMIQGRRYQALLVTMCGFVLHPVMGLATLMTGFIHETVKSDRRWRWIAFGGISALLLVAAGALGLPPAGRLFVTVQGAWLDAVLAASKAGTKDWGDGYFQLVFSAALTATLLFDQQQAVKRLGLATLLASALGLTLNYVGWDIFRSELILQCQPLRAIWVMVVISRIALLRLLIVDDEPSGLRRSASWMFLAAICVQGWPEIAAGLAGLSIVAVAPLLEAASPVARLCPAIRRVTVLCSVVLFAISVVSALQYLIHDYGLTDISAVALYALMPLFLLHIPNVVAAVGLGVLRAVRQRGTGVAIVPVTTIGFLILVSGILLTLSGQVTRAPERYEALSPLKQMLTRSGDVYWEQYPAETWFGLRRTSYISIPQVNVVAFSQKAAAEVLRRVEHLKVIGAPVTDLHARVPWTSYNHPWAPNGLSQLCADKKIAYVITDRQPYRAIAAVAIQPGSNFSFYVYDCFSLMPE